MNTTIHQLVADFQDWSGGFTPEECDAREIEAYLEAEEIEEDDERADVLWDMHNGAY